MGATISEAQGKAAALAYIIRKNAVTLKNVRGEAAFDRVTFSYGCGRFPRSTTFKAEPGETIALVGATAARNVR